MATAKDKKHQEFINQYFLCNLNQTEAYLKVYPKSSYDSARANSARLIADDNIQAEIEARLAEIKMSADEVLTRLADMARADIGDFVTFKDGIKLPFIDLKKAKDAGKLHLVKKIKYNAQGFIEFELHDPIPPLLNIGKQNGLFSDKHIIEMRLEKEIDSILDTLEGVLPPELYSNVLAAISGPETGGKTSTESQSAEVE